MNPTLYMTIAALVGVVATIVGVRGPQPREFRDDPAGAALLWGFLGFFIGAFWPITLICVAFCGLAWAVKRGAG